MTKQEQYKEMLKKATKAGACKEALEELSTYKTFEEMINKSEDAALYCHWYACNVLKGPFKLGEEVISKETRYSYLYARYALKGPFPEGEEVISKDAENSYEYAGNALKGPFPLGEKIISKSARHSYWYACNVLKGPFKLGEEVISKDTHYKIRYEEFLNEKRRTV